MNKVDHPGFIAVICGLKSEAAVVKKSVDGDKIRIGISGADAGRAYELARAASQDGAAAVISIGVSGGLDPALKSGDLVIGSEVIADDSGERFAADPYLLRILASSFETPTSLHPEERRRRVSKGEGKLAPQDEGIIGALFGSDAIIQSAEHKSALFYNHNAIAVDMESHGAARAAAEFSAPFIAIRAIADPADRALPKAAMNAVAPDGSTRVLATLLETAKAPGQFPALMQLGSDSEKALNTLRRDLGPLLGGLFLALDL